VKRFNHFGELVIDAKLATTLSILGDRRNAKCGAFALCDVIAGSGRTASKLLPEAVNFCENALQECSGWPDMSNRSSG
jgi:hypothetical protein